MCSKRFPRFSETFILNEILALERLGIEVEIFSLLKPPAEERHGFLDELGAPVTYLPSAGSLGRIQMRSWPQLKQFSWGDLIENKEHKFGDLFPAKTSEEVATLHLKAATLAFLAKQGVVDHLHAHFGSDATTAALLAGRLSGLGYSFTAHARDIFHTYASPEADNTMRRRKIIESRFVVTVSDYNANHLRNLCPDAAAKIHRLYNGIDLCRLQPAAEPARRYRIVGVGRLVGKKGFSDLIDACSNLDRLGVEFECLLVGDGPLRGDLETRIDALRLERSVRLAGCLPQERLIEIMRDAAVVTLPCVVDKSGDRDGLPTVLLEAMAVGTPAVTTTVSGGPEIITDGVNGFLVEPGNSDMLADRLRVILENEQLARRMGAAGRRRAEQLFSLDQNVATLAEYFEAATRCGPHLLERAS